MMVIVLTWPVTVMTDVIGVGVHVDFGDDSSEDDDVGVEALDMEEVVGAGGGLVGDVISTTDTEVDGRAGGAVVVVSVVVSRIVEGV